MPIAAAKLMLTSMHGTQAAVEGRWSASRRNRPGVYAARSTALTNDYIIVSRSRWPTPHASPCKKNMHALVDASVSLVSRSTRCHGVRPTSWLVFMLSQVIGNAVKYGARSVKISSHEEPETPRAGAPCSK